MIEKNTSFVVNHNQMSDPEKAAMVLEVYMLQKMQTIFAKKNGEKTVIKMYNKATRGESVDLRKLLTSLKVPKNVLKEAGSKSVKGLNDDVLEILRLMMLENDSIRDGSAHFNVERFMKWSKLDVSSATAFRRKTKFLSALGSNKKNANESKNTETVTAETLAGLIP